MKKKEFSNFELVQVHEANGYAEVVIRDSNNILAYAGNIQKLKNPKSVYPPKE